MSTRSPSSSRWPIGVLGGCLVLVLCTLLAGAAGAGWWVLSRRATPVAFEPAVEYILDASPRMAQAAKGASATRLSVAQGVLAEIVRPADPAVTAGLRVFGTGALPDACKDTDLIVPLGPARQAQISDEVLALQSGAAADAAVAEAMIFAIRDLAPTAGPRTLVVVTGGVDSCNPDAGQLVAAEAQRAGIELQLFVVGYQVAEADAEAIKSFVDDTGIGTYLRAEDEAILTAVLDAIQNYVDEPGTTSVADVQATAAAGAAASTATAVAGTATPTGTEGEATPTAAGSGDGVSATATPLTGTGYQSQTACDHPYFPMRLGATWTYATDAGDEVWTIGSVTGDLENATAEMLSTRAGNSSTIHWNCGADGITSYMFGSLAVLSRGTAEIKLLSSSGVFLPAASKLVSGATWENAYTVESVVEFSSATGDQITRVTDVAQSFTAVGLEPMAVSDQIVTALRVDGTAHYHTTVTGTGVTLPTTETDTTDKLTYWAAYGTGLVRMETTSSGATHTSKLVSYSIP